MRGIWSKKSRRRLLLFGLILILTGAPVANEVARRVTASLLGSYVDGHATVDKVRLGFRNVHVAGVRTWSPGCEQPVLSVRGIAAKLSIIDGVRSGAWVDKLVIDQPEIQIHFDATGELITNLPKGQSSAQDAEPIAKLPFRVIEIKDAVFAVHQTGRESLRIANVGVVVKGDGESFRARAIVPSILLGQVELRSEFNVARKTSESHVKIIGFRVASRELIKMPLVPPSLHSHPWAATATVEIQQRGSFSELSKVAASAIVHELRVSMIDQPEIFRVSGEASIEDGQVNSTLVGDAVGGTFEVVSRALLGATPRAQLRVKCHGLNTDSLPVGLLPSAVTSRLSTELDLNAAYANGIVHLKGGSSAQTSQTLALGVAIAPTNVQLVVDGGLAIDAAAGSYGSLSASVVSDGVSLEQLAHTGLKRLPSTNAQDVKTEMQRPPVLPPFVEPRGQVRAAASIKIPMATLADPATYLARGSVDSTGVVVNDVLVQNGRGTLVLDSNKVSVNFSDIQLVDQQNGEKSSITVIANSGLEDESRLNGEVRVNRISAATFARLAGLDRRVDGEIMARASLSCPRHQLNFPDRWLGKAAVQLRSIHVDDQLLAHCEARGEIASGTLTLRQLEGELSGGRIGGSGTVELQSPYSFQGNGSIRSMPLERLAVVAGQSPASVFGSIDASIQAGGELKSNRWRAVGAMVGSELRFGSRDFDDTQLDFEANPESVVVRAPAQGFLGGDLRLHFIQFSEVSGQIVDLPLSAVARAVGTNERIDGHVSCTFKSNITSDIQGMNAMATIESPGVAVRDAALRGIRADVQLLNGRADLNARAVGLDGELNLQANADMKRLLQLTPGERETPSGWPVNGIATVDAMNLAELWPILGQQEQLRHLRGKMSATFERSIAEREHGKIAVGELKLHDLRWDNVLWSNQLRAEVSLGDRLAEVRRLTGQFAGGRINGRGGVALDGSNNGSFELSASRVSLRKALVPIDRRGELADGHLSLRVNGRLGARPSGRALVAMDRGTAGPIALARLRVPIDWSVDPRAKSAQWRTTNAGVEIGGGRVVTNAEGRWNGKLDLTMTTSARRVDTGRILAGRTSPGSGYLDGTFRLKAKRALAADDFTGTFDATLSDATSLQLPVVSDLTKFLKTIPTTTSYDESRIQGRLGNGMIHLDRVTLAAANAQILAEGTATLQGRLNLQVMAKTGETGPADKLLELADSPLLMAAPTPIGLVAKANTALKDRVVHLRIGGTAARPVIRLEPGRQIGQEAIKFFMNQAIAFRNPKDEFSFR